MITEKEKAKEILNKMYNGSPFDKTDKERLLELENAKRCAIICVDEILMFDIRAKSEAQFVIQQRIDEYWQSVKTEIEKL